MLEKSWKWIKLYLKPLKSSSLPPNLELTSRERAMSRYPITFTPIFGDSDEDIHRRNMQRIETARFAQDREAIDKNLLAQHRIMIATLLLAAVAVASTITAVIIALTAKPPAVTVRPNITVQTKR